MSKGAVKTEGEKLIASNPVARSHYFIQEVLEGGLALTGTEVKSLRTQTPNLRDSFVEVQSSGKRFEAWLINVHISPYSHGNIWNHDPLRRRKVLLHRYQLEKIYGAVIQKGMSLVPIRLYFKKGRVKVELGLGKGKKLHDKREDVKQKTAKREMEQALKRER
jgi:SsrA-binding protein